MMQIFDDRTNNIIKAGIILIVYSIILFVTYIALHDPMSAVLTGFIDSSLADEIPQLATYGTPMRDFYLNIIFALAFFLPIVWFIIWCIREEPSVGYYKRW